MFNLRMLRFEMYKLWQGRTLPVLAAALLFLSFLLSYTVTLDTVDVVVWRKVQNYLAPLSEADKAKFISERCELLNVSGDSFALNRPEADGTQAVLLFAERAEDEIAVFYRLEQEQKAQTEYASYVDGVIDKAEHSSFAIFAAKDEFTVADEQRSAEVYKQLRGRRLSLVNNFAFDAAVGNIAADAFLVLVLVYLVAELLLKERSRQLIELFYPMRNGRVPFLASKLGLLFVMSLFLVAAFQAVNLASAVLKFGALDFTAALQSFAAFRSSALGINAGQYFLLMFLQKSVAAVFLTAVMLFIAQKAKSAAGYFASATVVVLAEYLLYSLVGVGQALSFLKYINIFSFLSPYDIYHHYFNVNLFQQAVPIAGLVWVGLLLLLVLSICGNLWYFAGKKPRLGIVSVQSKGSGQIHTSLRKHEHSKLLWNQKVLVLLLAFVALQGFLLYQEMHKPQDTNESFIKAIWIFSPVRWTLLSWSSWSKRSCVFKICAVSKRSCISC